MRIELSPVDGLPTVSYVKRGESVLVNGEEFDFSKVGEGDTLAVSAIQSTWFSGPVERSNGELTVALFLPLPSNFSPEQAFPVPLENVPDGPVQLPGPLPDPASNTALESEA
ncbi:hypothetical protein [Pseudomonas fluorescens]|uniref:hypothetical protein n=1 Tax=Pseudomonas fluorescens TaxID=294 RepID=UPI00064234A0|nr:hypothetical protein [Pseudomonas fluorescens]